MRAVNGEEEHAQAENPGKRGADDSPEPLPLASAITDQDRIATHAMRTAQ
jgi:hypothetical protein